MGYYNKVIFLVILLIVVGSPVRAGAVPDLNGKINFNINKLNDNGLYGPPSGLRALHYEFCIPADPQAAAQVRAIDPTIVIHQNSPGRSKCSGEEYLCLGNTHQRDFRAVLLKLASLPFVKQINQCFFE